MIHRDMNQFWNMKPLRLNIGCGYRARDGWVNIDLTSFSDANLVWDIKDGLPFKNDSVDEVYASHIMEHITAEEVIRLMREIWRVCKDRAVVEIRVPHKDSVGAYELTHRSIIAKDTFRVFTPMGSVQSLIRENLGFMYFKQIGIIDDPKGNIEPTPQTYFKLEVDKSNV